MYERVVPEGDSTPPVTCGFTELLTTLDTNQQVSAGCDVSEGRVAGYVHACHHR
jgi:hypothetical protein